eukprot:3004869-Alexandrium_andersonii.AAC.1
MAPSAPSAWARAVRPVGADFLVAMPSTASACADSARSAGRPLGVPLVDETSLMPTGIVSIAGRR